MLRTHDSGLQGPTSPPNTRQSRCRNGPANTGSLLSEIVEGWGPQQLPVCKRCWLDVARQSRGELEAWYRKGGRLRLPLGLWVSGKELGAQAAVYGCLVASQWLFRSRCYRVFAPYPCGTSLSRQSCSPNLLHCKCSCVLPVPRCYHQESAGVTGSAQCVSGPSKAERFMPKPVLTKSVNELVRISTKGLHGTARADASTPEEGEHA